MKRLIMALVMVAVCGATRADVKYAVYKLTESEAFDLQSSPYKDGLWVDDTDKRQNGLLLIQYSTTPGSDASATKSPDSSSASLNLMRASRFYLAKGHSGRVAWAIPLDETYQLTAINDDLAAFTHIAGDTKSSLDESVSMILLGKLDDGVIKSLKGTQLTIDKGWKLAQEDFSLRRHQGLSEAAQEAGAEGYDAALNCVVNYLWHQGYTFGK